MDPGEQNHSLYFNSADVFVKIHARVCWSTKHINHSLPWNAEPNGVLGGKTKRSIETTWTTDAGAAFNKIWEQNRSRVQDNTSGQQGTDTGKVQRSMGRANALYFQHYWRWLPLRKFWWKWYSEIRNAQFGGKNVNKWNCDFSDKNCDCDVKYNLKIFQVCCAYL